MAGATGMHNEDSSQGSPTRVCTRYDLSRAQQTLASIRCSGRTRIVYELVSFVVVKPVCALSAVGTHIPVRHQAQRFLCLCRKHTRNQRPRPRRLQFVVKESRQRFASSRTPRVMQNAYRGTAKIKQIQDTQFYLDYNMLL